MMPHTTHLRLQGIHALTRHIPASGYYVPPDVRMCARIARPDVCGCVVDAPDVWFWVRVRIGHQSRLPTPFKRVRPMVTYLAMSYVLDSVIPSDARCALMRRMRQHGLAHPYGSRLGAWPQRPQGPFHIPEAQFAPTEAPATAPLRDDRGAEVPLDCPCAPVA